MDTCKKITIIFFSILVLFSARFGHAANKKEPISFHLLEIIPSSEEENKHTIILKITNRNSSGAAKIQEVYFAPSLNQDVDVVSTDVSQCSLLEPGTSCQASAVILADRDYVNAPMPVDISYVIDREDSNTNTGSGLAFSNVFLDNSIVIDAEKTSNNVASSAENLEFTNTSCPNVSFQKAYGVSDTINFGAIDNGVVTNTKNLEFIDTSYPKLTFRNNSGKLIKNILNVSLESGRATLYEISNRKLSVKGPESSCEITMKLGWSDWFKFKDMPSKKDYIIINYEDAEGNVKETSIPINTIVSGNGVVWYALTGTALAAGAVAGIVASPVTIVSVVVGSAAVGGTAGYVADGAEGAVYGALAVGGSAAVASVLGKGISYALSSNPIQNKPNVASPTTTKPTLKKSKQRRRIEGKNTASLVEAYEKLGRGERN